MPYKSDKIIIANSEYDRRIKLSDEEREQITDLHEKGYSQRKLAIMFEVDRKTIYNIINPEKYLEQLKTRSKDEAWKKYYKKEINTKAIRETRKYKQKLYKKGKIEFD